MKAILFVCLLLLCGCAADGDLHTYVVSKDGAPVDTVNAWTMVGSRNEAKAYDRVYRVVAYYNGPGYAFREVPR